MVGLGEEWNEIISVMQAIRDVGCDILTLGQYLSPRRETLCRSGVTIHPEEFENVEVRR